MMKRKDPTRNKSEASRERTGFAAESWPAVLPTNRPRKRHLRNKIRIKTSEHRHLDSHYSIGNLDRFGTVL